jgi:hypothetical protein
VRSVRAGRRRAASLLSFAKIMDSRPLDCCEAP